MEYNEAKQEWEAARFELEAKLLEVGQRGRGGAGEGQGRAVGQGGGQGGGQAAVAAFPESSPEWGGVAGVVGLEAKLLEVG